MASRGGVKTFEALADQIGEESSVDGAARTTVLAPRSGMSRSVPLKDLVGNPHNPRDSLGDLDELASIKDFQLQPVVVVTRAAFEKLYPESGIACRWVVVIGNRRLAAAQKFGRPELDVVIKDELAKDRATLLTAVIAENVDRSGFDVIEEAKAVEDLVRAFGSADAAAEHLRKSKTWVSQRRALLGLAPDLQEATRRGDLAIREARTLARVPREEQVKRWQANRPPGAGAGVRAEDDRTNSGSGDTDADADPTPREGAAPLRAVTRAVRNFEAAPHALASALHEQLGDAGTRTLVSHLRKQLK